MGSGEIPNELGDSWFSPKSLKGEPPESRILEVEHCLDEGPVMGYRLQINSNANDLCPGVRR